MQPQLKSTVATGVKVTGQPRAPLPGGNARDRRRARRQAERLKTEMESAIAAAPWNQTSRNSGPSTTANQAAAFTTPIASLPYRRPFTSHNETSLPYSTTAIQSSYSAPAFQQSHSEYVFDISQLWQRGTEEPSTLGFPSALSIPAPTTLQARPPMFLPSAAYIGCHDPEVDYLLDLERLTDVRTLSAALGKKGRHVRNASSTASVRSSGSGRSDSSRSWRPTTSSLLRDDVPDLCSSPSTMSSTSLPPTPPNAFAPLPPSFSSSETFNKIPEFPYNPSAWRAIY